MMTENSSKYILRDEILNLEVHFYKPLMCFSFQQQQQQHQTVGPQEPGQLRDGRARGQCPGVGRAGPRLRAALLSPLRPGPAPSWTPRSPSRSSPTPRLCRQPPPASRQRVCKVPPPPLIGQTEKFLLVKTVRNPDPMIKWAS